MRGLTNGGKEAGNAAECRLLTELLQCGLRRC